MSVKPLTPKEVDDINIVNIDIEVEKINEELKRNPIARQFDVSPDKINEVSNAFKAAGWDVKIYSGSDYRDSWSYIVLSKPTDAKTIRDYYNK